MSFASFAFQACAFNHSAISPTLESYTCRRLLRDESGIVIRPLMFKDHLRASYWSAERERERLHTGIEELDLELAIGDRSRLSNQLIQALLGDRAVALVVYVSSMARARRPSIDQHSKRNGSSASG